MDNTYPMLAKTFAGLEDVLRDELISLGAENVEMGTRMVSFEGDLALMYRANLCCRTALKILKPIEKFLADNPDELYDAVREIDWSKYMSPNTTFSISSTVNSTDFTHSKFVTYRVKDGIVDHFYDRTGTRPSIRLHGADLQLDVHIIDNRVTISLNSSGEPLCHRGYRVAATEAPINEVLAAGIIMKTGWRGDTLFLDPMCGSGTFLIEAALIAANINPGVFRESYAFERWNDFDSELFEALYNDDSEECPASFPIIGSDIDPEAVAIARQNIKSARLEEYITLGCRDFNSYQEAPDSEPGIIVTNPPYGQRLSDETELQQLFRQMGTTLKMNFGGYHVWILGYKDEAFASIGLKPSVKFPINNGGLECTLREYVLFDGNYADFRTQGGSVKNEDFNRMQKPRYKRTSDEEWERGATLHRSKANKRDYRDERRDNKRANKRDDRRNDKRKYDSRSGNRHDDRDDRNFGRRDYNRDEKRGDKRDEKKRSDRKQNTRVRTDYVPSGRGPAMENKTPDFKAPARMRSRKRPRNDYENED